MPAVVIETNIRSVFIHFFFQQKKTGKVRRKIHDKQIIPLVEKTLPKKPFNKSRTGPREWYWALFDYGVFLKKTSNPSRQSLHHAKQSKFIGSYRQKRAHVLRTILNKPYNLKEIQKVTGYDAIIVSNILFALEKETLVKKTKKGLYAIA